MSFPSLKRTIYGRLFGLVSGHFKENGRSFSHEYLERFNLGTNWGGGIIHRYRYRPDNYYGSNGTNNILSKYSKIWIEHNIVSLKFEEEILIINKKSDYMLQDDNKLVSNTANCFIKSLSELTHSNSNSNIAHYNLKRTRFLLKPVSDSIEWYQMPKILIHNIDKKSDKNIKNCSCCGVWNKFSNSV